jgi:hypothetical protein
MTIEEGEVRFDGKSWKAWNTAEVREFVSLMTAENMRNPGCLMMFAAHPDVASEECLERMFNVYREERGLKNAILTVAEMLLMSMERNEADSVIEGVG